MNLLSLIIGVVIGITISHIFVIFFRGLDDIILKPSDLGWQTKLNDFGQWSLYIIIAICSPVVFLFKAIYLLTHIGK